MTELDILECTLRDGSYTIDFQFTAKDTAVIAAALERAGFNMIEVGHGLGLNASKAGKGVAAETDEAYMQAVTEALSRAQWGMFFIPGVGRHEDLELAARYGMDFVRIGTNATEVEESREYIEHAKRLGMFVSANLMKSYALPPGELAQQAKRSVAYGVDLVCLVDSAGYMLPGDVRAYLSAMQEVIEVPVGLHCHDNLGLGMANVLAAVECGARIVDSTMQGMGRGGGNPPTEVLAAVLKKQGIDLGIDLNLLMDSSERLIKPLLKAKGWDSIDIASGYAGFHSSHLQTILKYADRYGVDPRDLIVGVCEIDQVYAPEDVVEDVAQRLQRRQTGQAGLYVVSLPRLTFDPTNEAEPLGAAVRKVAEAVRMTAKKHGRLGVLNVVAPLQPTGRAMVSRFVQEEFDYVIGSVEVDNTAQLDEVVVAADGVVDIFFVDAERKPYLNASLAGSVEGLAHHSRMLSYKDNDVWVRSVAQAMAALLSALAGQRITLYGTDNLALKLALLLLERGAAVTLSGAGMVDLEASAQALDRLALAGAALNVEADPVVAARDAAALVSFARGEPFINREMVEAMAPAGVVFDAGIGAVSSDAIAYANKHAVRVVRPDMRAALAAELESILGTQRIIDEIMGRGEIAGVPVVAGGLIGERGALVLDSISNPTRVVGVADGRGRVMYDRAADYADAIAAVDAEILRRQIVLK